MGDKYAAQKAQIARIEKLELLRKKYNLDQFSRIVLGREYLRNPKNAAQINAYRDILYRLHHEEKLNPVQIARLLGRAHQSISTHMMQLGITIRPGVGKQQKTQKKLFENHLANLLIQKKLPVSVKSASQISIIAFPKNLRPKPKIFTRQIINTIQEPKFKKRVYKLKQAKLRTK